MFLSVYHMCKVHDDIPDEKIHNVDIYQKPNIPRSRVVACPINFSIPRLLLLVE